MSIQTINPTDLKPILQTPQYKKDLFKHNLICTKPIKTIPPFMGTKLDETA